ncbi:MAG: transketolase, transketolase [Candidatus Taylorbacteria bacterium]|nr:transketolase, transketolase [Candidatus Taylorbacteria bacterium]
MLYFHQHMALTDEKIKDLEGKALDIRRSIIEMLIEAKTGHTAGPLDMTDIFTYLYFIALKHDPKKPDWQYRDRVVLSNGHICPVLYATMAHSGYFPVSELKTLRKFGSRLQGHPHREWLPMLETSSGPLGSGLSQAVGMAIAERIDTGRTGSKQMYCFLGDGELDEGQNWEAIMLAGRERLGNLTVVVDRNNIQIDGFTEDIMPLNPLPDKWRAFNWHVQEVDGHNFRAIDEAFGQARAVSDRPSVIIAYTIPGKGVPEFEGKFEWHGKAPTTPEEIEQVKRALWNVRTLGGKIQSENESA